MGSTRQAKLSRKESLVESLLSRCAELSPGSRLPTVRSLATSLGASTSTLDQVLGELERAGRIERRRGSGLFVAAPRKASVVAMVSGVDPFAVGQSPFYQLVGNRVREGVAASGLDFKFYLDPHFVNHGMPSREDFLADLADGKLLGAVFIATAHPELFERMNGIGFPYVGMTDCPDARHRFHIDAASLVALGVDALARVGRKRLCLLAWDGFGSQIEQCHQVFERSLRDHGLPLLAGAVWGRKEPRPEDEVKPRHFFGAMAATEFLAQGDFDGMVCCDDMLCVGALDTLRERSSDGLLVATHANKGSPVLGLAAEGVIKLQVDTDALVADVLATIHRLAGGENVEPFCEHAKVEVVPCARI